MEDSKVTQRTDTHRLTGKKIERKWGFHARDLRENKQGWEEEEEASRREMSQERARHPNIFRARAAKDSQRLLPSAGVD